MEVLNKKIAGLSNSLSDHNGEFYYSCYLSSSYLDDRVRSNRTGFNIEENIEGLFKDTELSLNKIREEVFQQIKKHLGHALLKNIEEAKRHIEKFVSTTAPKYRSILKYIYESDAILDATVSDKELELFLHKEFVKIESRVMKNAHKIRAPIQGENANDYYQRVQKYLSNVSDIKKTDLVSYVSHRRVVIDLLENAIKSFDGKYVTEKIIHNLIMPMGKTSNDIPFEENNLWLLDEKLVFHDYLASDKPIKSMPITESHEKKEPDILSLNVYDNPLLVSAQQTLPLASIVVIEIKRPMRNDAQAGEDKDPIEQALDYLEKVRLGKVKTASGRPIPDSSDIPGYCYILCDLTDSIKKRCKVWDLKITSDKLGYFGYKDSYKAYIEVISYEQLLNSAKKRNCAFFDKLNIPLH